MSHYPPPSEAETTAYPTYASTSDGAVSHANLVYPPGQHIDPNLRGAEALTTDAEHAALQQLQNAAALQDADITAQAATQAAAAAAAAQAAHQAEKTKRVAQACDACSQRKVKCDEGSPCKNCADLDVECTRNRQRRRRGPPNRVKERIEVDKRTRTLHDLDVSTAAALSASAQLLEPGSQPSTDMIAPPDIVQRLLSEFFTYIYPIYPFPHEPRLLQAFNRRADITDGPHNPVLALLFSMMALLGTVRPRQTLQLVEPLGYTSIEAFVAQAKHFCLNARGLGYIERDDLDITDAATSFFLALLSLHNQRYNQYQLYISEALEVVHSQLLLGSQGAPQDEVEVQIARRIFWSGYASNHAVSDWMHLPSRPVYGITAPPYPAALDDDQILPQQSSSEPVKDDPSSKFGALTLTLDALVNTYNMADQLVPPYFTGSDTDILEAVKSVRNSVNGLDPHIKELVNSTYAQRSEDTSNRAARYEVQRTHLLLSNLLLRISLIERTSKPSPRARKVMEEFTSVAHGLLFLFRDLHYSAIEHDASSVQERIQRIVSALVDSSLPDVEAATYETVAQFAELLRNLVQAKSDEMRFHASNALRMYQETFAKMVEEGKVKAVFA